MAEEAWLPVRRSLPEAGFLKGLVHAAVALCHYQRGNGHGARTKYASARRYLEPFLPTCHGLDVARLLAEMDRFFADLIALPRGSSPPAPRQPWPRAVLSDPAREGPTA